MIDKLIQCPHLLIAGATGSGKSTIEQILLYHLTSQSNENPYLWLVDPKKVELYDWKTAATCQAYGDDADSIISLLRDLNNEMDRRYTDMRLKHLKKTEERHIFCLIDEYSDLVYGGYRRAVEPVLCRLLALGRAAGIHMVIATQRPTAEIITGMIKANIGDRIALHCVTAQDSRNIIGVSGAELLPRYGQAIVSLADGSITRINIKPVDEQALEKRIKDLKGETKMNRKEMIILIKDYRNEKRLETTPHTFLEDIASCEWMKEQFYDVGVSYFDNKDEMYGHGHRCSILKKLGGHEMYIPCVDINGMNTQAEYYVPHPCESFKVDMRSFVIRCIESDFEKDDSIEAYISIRRNVIHHLIAISDLRHKNDKCDSAWDGDYDHLTDEEIKAGKL